MPVYRQKKCTTPNTPDSTEGQSAPALPTPQQFQQHLRELARGAIRVVLEDVMREELDALKGRGRTEEHVRNEPADRAGLTGAGFLRLCSLVHLNATSASLADNGLFPGHDPFACRS